MARPAPGADRSVAVLDLLADHPDERFTLSEVARRCGLNKATAHALLSALSDHGVLLRHPAEKRYSLGPRLVAIGDAARRGYSAVDFVSGVLDRLDDATGLVARGWRVEDDSLVAVGRARDWRDRDIDGAVRLPLAPPLGAVFMAWADAPTTEAWLARAAAIEAVRAAHDALPAIRGLGFGVTLASPEWGALVAPPPGPPPSPDTRRSLLLAVARQGLLPTSIEPDAKYRPAEVAAPVFSAGGRVELAVAVAGPADEDVTGARLLALGREVAAAADDLTAAVRGLRPPAAPVT